MSKSLIHISINAGRTQMRSEILVKIWKLVEEASKKGNYEVAQAFVDAYETVRDMPIRVEDKQQVEAK